ncbi:MAG TPA: molybdopterin-dependent oxidoreductase [Bacilli bacterium]|nr:molybdopterin-dependent oxidoreductase [Bacilli bacterium]
MKQEQTERPFLVQVRGLVERDIDLHDSDFFAGKVGPAVDVTPIVPTFSGKATPISSVLETIRVKEEATHVIFHASDEFQATLPREELTNALLLFQQENGEPLRKGFPVRLLVPNGKSDCLNVKSVVKMEFVRLDDPKRESTFGFKNVVPAQEL